MKMNDENGSEEIPRPSLSSEPDFDDQLGLSDVNEDALDDKTSFTTDGQLQGESLIVYV